MNAKDVTPPTKVVVDPTKPAPPADTRPPTGADLGIPPSKVKPGGDVNPKDVNQRTTGGSPKPVE